MIGTDRPAELRDELGVAHRRGGVWLRQQRALG